MNITNEDNMDLMARYDDNHFDLAIVDPPYGIDVDNRSDHGKKRSVKSAARSKDYKKKGWDSQVPNEYYFRELFRISKNQIIWGINYYPYNFLNGGRIFWDKGTAKGFTNGDGELAYCSKTNTIRKVSIIWNGMIQHDMKNKEQRIHPTQKPVKLYEWLLMNYAKEGDKILDTHLGSGSIAIACHNLGFDLTACELDKEYYDAAIKRLHDHKLQQKLF
jgi:site-specific DNA-methyltransferase (adenine-specific)